MLFPGTEPACGLSVAFSGLRKLVALMLSSWCLSLVVVSVAGTTSQHGPHLRLGWAMPYGGYLLCLICQICPFPSAGHSHGSRHSAVAGLKALLVDSVPKLRDPSLQVRYSAVACRFLGVESAETYFDSRLEVRFALFLLCC